MFHRKKPAQELNIEGRFPWDADKRRERGALGCIEGTGNRSGIIEWLFRFLQLILWILKKNLRKYILQFLFSLQD